MKSRESFSIFAFAGGTIVPTMTATKKRKAPGLSDSFMP
jgi:hypothetical protein